MTVQEAIRRGELRLAREELDRIERQIGTGSARTATGEWSSAEARRLSRLRYREALSRARLITLQEAAA
jgi:hypothetical protein